MDTNITTDTVELDELATADTSDNGGTSNLPLMGVALVAGAVIGKFVVPPVVGFVKRRFSKSEPAVVLEIAAPAETPETEEIAV